MKSSMHLMVPASNARSLWLLFNYISRCRTGTSTTTFHMSIINHIFQKIKSKFYLPTSPPKNQEGIRGLWLLSVLFIPFVNGHIWIFVQFGCVKIRTSDIHTTHSPTIAICRISKRGCLSAFRANIHQRFDIIPSLQSAFWHITHFLLLLFQASIASSLPSNFISAWHSTQHTQYESKHQLIIALPPQNGHGFNSFIVFLQINKLHKLIVRI